MCVVKRELFPVTEKILEADYCVKEVYGNKQPSVVYFNRPKLCKPGTRLPSPPPDTEDETPETTIQRPKQTTFELELVELKTILHH